MQKGIQFRIYPDKAQKNLIGRTFGCCRLIYNKGLALRNEAFTLGQKKNYSDTSSMLTELKKQEDFSFLKEVDSVALQQALRDLDRSFRNLFEKRAAHPRFRSKHDHLQSFRTINQNDSIRIVGDRIRLPKVGFLKVKQSMDVGHINHATVKRMPSGKYFLVLNVEFEPEKRPNAGGELGLDIGIKAFYFDSNGNVIENPKYLEKSMRRLAVLQRRLSRKEKGSKNRDKQRIRLACLYEKISNQRNDFIQKQSTMLIRENQTICVEDLNVKGMIRNHKLAKSIASVSWSRFLSILAYKAEWYGNRFIRIPRMYPSSQTCSICGYRNPLVKDLAVRRWECPKCHAIHDRDENAAINILRTGLAMA